MARVDYHVLLEFMQASRDDALPVREPIAYIWQSVMGVTVVHGGSTVVKENVN